MIYHMKHLNETLSAKHRSSLSSYINRFISSMLSSSIVIAGSFRVNLVIDFSFLFSLGGGAADDFMKGWRGILGTFMIRRPNLQYSDGMEFTF